MIKGVSMLQRFTLDDFLTDIAEKNPQQPEFLQAVKEVLHSIWPYLEQHPKYFEQGLLARLVEPERLIQFRVSWVDDQGQVQVNRAFRIQHNSAIGPFKGGMRFHPSVNQSVLKFLAFEQTFKNALTTLPLGGGKGGSDFNPKGKSDGEVMRFCQALMLELHRHLGSDTDIPAGDIGVGAREVGYMAGMMKKLTNSNECVFTGKGLSFGGSLIRPEATGYGLLYFVEAMLDTQHTKLEGMRVAVSGSGNVAQYAIEKAIAMGAIVVTASDSSGVVYDPNGFTIEKLTKLKDIKNTNRLRVADYAKAMKLEYFAAGSPWQFNVDIALPCATQNELTLEHANMLIKNGVKLVAEGANMPTTADAILALHQAKVLFAPGKASNAGGVATSGLEMSQNSQRLNWTQEQVDQKLKQIMNSIHSACVTYGTQADNQTNYEQGANIAGFVKVAEAMMAQGVY